MINLIGSNLLHHSDDNDHFLQTIHLYYDDFDETNVPFIKVSVGYDQGDPDEDGN